MGCKISKSTSSAEKATTTTTTNTTTTGSPANNLSAVSLTNINNASLVKPLLNPKSLVKEGASEALKERAKQIIKKDDAASFKNLLLEISPLHNLDEDEGDDNTCLHCAAENNSYKVMDLMITWLKENRKEDLKIFLNFDNIINQSALSYCIIRNSLECCYIIAKNGGIDWNYITVRKWSLIQLAEKYNSECLDILIEFQNDQLNQEKNASRQNKIKEIVDRIEKSKNWENKKG